MTASQYPSVPPSPAKLETEDFYNQFENHEHYPEPPADWSRPEWWENKQ